MRANQRRAMFAKLAREEAASAKRYDRLGLHSIAKDERRHKTVVYRLSKKYQTRT